MTIACPIDFHEVANIFPLMQQDEFADLVQDIKANGLREPVWTYRGEIIDGRNRYKACLEIGIDPQFREWNGEGSLVAFVVSLNLKRRHLTSSQKAMIALEIERQLAVEAKERQRLAGSLFGENHPKEEVVENFQQPLNGRASEQAAEMVGTNSHYIVDAKKIAKEAPELIEHVRDGTLTIPDAKAIAELPKERQTAVLEKAVKAKEEDGKRVSRAVKDAIAEEKEETEPQSVLSSKPGLLEWRHNLLELEQQLDEEQEKRDAHVMRVMGSSESPEWYTPQEIVQRSIACLGEIDLDPCSNSHETPSIPAKNRYTKDDDGLVHSWFGKVYLNPPYGSEISQWTNRLIEFYELGEVKEAIALLPARIDTIWFQPLYEYPMCNIRGRLQFANSPYNAPFPCVVVYLGEHIQAFIEHFKSLGPIMRRIA